MPISFWHIAGLIEDSTPCFLRTKYNGRWFQNIKGLLWCCKSSLPFYEYLECLPDLPCQNTKATQKKQKVCNLPFFSLDASHCCYWSLTLVWKSERMNWCKQLLLLFVKDMQYTYLPSNEGWLSKNCPFTFFCNTSWITNAARCKEGSWQVGKI